MKIKFMDVRPGEKFVYENLNCVALQSPRTDGTNVVTQELNFINIKPLTEVEVKRDMSNFFDLEDGTQFIFENQVFTKINGCQICPTSSIIYIKSVKNEVMMVEVKKG